MTNPNVILGEETVLHEEEVVDIFDGVSSYLRRALKKEGLIHEETHEPEDYDDGEFTALIVFSKKVIPSLRIIIAGNIHLEFDGQGLKEEGRVQFSMAWIEIAGAGKEEDFIEEDIATVDLKFDKNNQVKSHRIEWE